MSTMPPRSSPEHVLPGGANKALRCLDSTSLDEARPSAVSELRAAERCECCKRVLSQLHERVGSTLFRDADPAQLALAFDATDRKECTVRLLAAYIVLFGRPRVPIRPLQ